MRQTRLPFMLPLAAILFVVLWGGGVGVIFIVLGKTGIGEWGAIIGGIALAVLVPAIASILTLPKR